MPKTLLAVDDSATMRKAFEITFSGEDFTVITADGAQAALDKLAQNPEVVLVDAGLDGGNGYALAKSIREKVPSAAIVLFSSKHAPYDAAKGKDAGADDFMDKPFDTQQLIDKVTKLAGAPRAASAAAGSPYRAPAAPAASPAPGPVAAKPSPGKATQPSATPARAAEPKRDATPAPGAVAAAAPSPLASSIDGLLAPKLDGLGLSKEQVDAVLGLSRDVVERVVWEVVPQLAEALIKEEIARVMRE